MPFDTLPAIDPEIELAPQDLGRATLRHAAQLLRERGHVKKALIDHRGSLCFYGAILMAAHEDCFAGVNNVHKATTSDAHRSAVAIIEQLLPLDGWIVWNNLPERTADEVIDALDAMGNGRAP